VSILTGAVRSLSSDALSNKPIDLPIQPLICVFPRSDAEARYARLWCCYAAARLYANLWLVMSTVSMQP
jgi:hypothetical protein